MTEQELRAKVVSIAQSYLGCKESDGSHKKIIDLYNQGKPSYCTYKMTYNDAWCATFVSACFIKAGLIDIAPCECSCSRMIVQYQKINSWQERDDYVPAPGDVIMYDWQDNGVGDNTGDPDHVGIVVSVTGNKIKIIEGNMSNAVNYRELVVNGRYIRGYCLPKYNTKATAATAATATTTTASTPVATATSGMKYNDKNKPLVCMQTQSTCYKGTSKMRPYGRPLGVLWHSTGANNPWLKRYVQPSDNAADKAAMLKLLGTNTNKNDWNHISRQAGLNCWIGKLADGTVATVQTQPWDWRPWGCGSGKKGSCNDAWVQFEICEDGLTDKAYFNAVYKEACELTAYICKMYNIDPKGTVQFNGVTVPTILCHYDSYKLGLGGNHGDVYHWFNKHGKTMDDVRNDVAALMKGTATTSVTTPVAPAASGTAVNYKGVVTTKGDNLNCRSTYSTSGKIITSYPNGTVLTITKEQNGWGYANNTGWVSLSYIKKVEDALDKLTRLGIINSPDYWRQVVSSGKVPYLDLLLDKTAVKITKAGKKCTTIEEAITALQKAGIINTPDYWRNTANTSTVQYLKDLLMLIGGAVK